MAARIYSKTDAQARTIEGLFLIMAQENPRAAETLLVKLQRMARERSNKGRNVG